MSGAITPAAIMVLGVLILAGTALAHRNLGGSRLLRLALIWVAIILVTWGAVTLGMRLR